VMFKSFLVAMPEGQLGAFQDTVRMQSQDPAVSSSQRLFRHRRMTSIAGE